jgi:serine/threonine protein kinase
MSDLYIKPGNQLDNFQLDDIVAKSGMATVFRAHDLDTGRQVAIKVPHPEVEADPNLYDRFKREQDIGEKMDHPGVMKVFASPNRSQVYMVMEWRDGRLLRQIMNEQKKLPIERAVKLTIGICNALEYIHSHGVVHRDLKPENIMVDENDNICLIDFGIAASAGSRRLTFAHFSQSMGTPDYISPEQVRGKRGDARSDIYSLGVMLYEMVTGKVPFSGPNPFSVMNDRLLNHPVPPRKLEPSITPQLQEIIYRALEREPKHRYASASEFAHDLENQHIVAPADRAAESQWEQRKSPAVRRMLTHAAIAMIPIIIFALLFLVARH